MSHEVTETFNLPNGKWYVAPTVGPNKGKMLDGLLFDTMKEANAFARTRSREEGRRLFFGGVPPSKMPRIDPVPRVKPNPGINLFNPENLKSEVERRRSRGLPRLEATALLKKDFDAFRENFFVPRDPAGPDGLRGFFEDVVGDMIPGAAVGTVVGREAVRMARTRLFDDIVKKGREMGFSPEESAQSAQKALDVTPIKTSHGAEINQSFKEARKLYDDTWDNLTVGEVVRDPVTGLTNIPKLKEARRNITRKTGWWQGADGKLRYEISDQGWGLQDRESVDILLRDHERVGRGEFWVRTIGDLFDHPDLFKLYPNLRKVRLKWSDEMPLGSVAKVNHDVDPPIISLNRDYLDRFFTLDPNLGYTNPNANVGVGKELLDTILHELQHVIQRKENFALGGNPQRAWEAFEEGVKGRISNIKRDLEAIPNDMPLLQANLSSQLQGQRILLQEIRQANPETMQEYYYRLAAETESRATEARRHFSQEDIQNYPRIDWYNDVEERYPQTNFDINAGRVPEERQILR